jgi:hypothetical protein
VPLTLEQIKERIEAALRRNEKSPYTRLLVNPDEGESFPVRYVNLINALQKPELHTEEAAILLANLLSNPDYPIPSNYIGSCVDLRRYLKYTSIEFQSLTRLQISFHLLSLHPASKKFLDYFEACYNKSFALEEVDLYLFRYLMDRLSSTSLPSVDLDCLEFEQLKAPQWQALCIGIQNSNKVALVLSWARLKKMSAEKIQLLYSAIQNSACSAIYLKECVGLEEDESQWNTFCAALQTWPIIFLDFQSNELRKMPSRRWQNLCIALQRSRIRTLGLRDLLGVSFLQPMQLKILQEAICDSSLDSIDFSRNYLGRNNDNAVWNILFLIIKNPKITMIMLKDNFLQDLRENIREDLCSAIQQAQCTSLDLGSNELGIRSLQFSLSAVENPKLLYLGLSDNRLNKLNGLEWNILLNTIKRSNLIYLDLADNDLYLLDTTIWQAFAAAIQDSKIISLNLSGNSLRALNKNTWSILYAMLENKPFLTVTLKDNDYSVSEPNYNEKSITRVLARHCVWQNLCVQMQAGLAMLHEKPLDEKCISGIQSLLAELDIELASLAKSVSMAEIKAFHALRSLRDEYFWQYSDKMLEHHYVLEPCILLNISPASPHYLDAQEMIFSTTYEGLRDSGKSAHTSLLMALPYCLDKDGNWLPFDTNTQTRIDGLLLETVTREKAIFLYQPLEKKERIVLLQFIVLSEYLQNRYAAQEALPFSLVVEAAAAAASSPGTFFNEQRESVCCILHTELPESISSQQCHESDIQIKLNNLWEKVQRRLLNLLSADQSTLITLINAINKLIIKLDAEVETSKHRLLPII